MPRTIQRFVVVAELGRGGMGVVVRATDPRLDRDGLERLCRYGARSPAGIPVVASVGTTAARR